MKKTILFATGGTAGHISPALATARTLKQIEPARRIIFVIDKPDRERPFSTAQTLFDEYNFLVEKIISSGLPLNRFSLKFLIFMLKLCIGFFSSLFLVVKYRPSLVVGFGGYVSFPVVMAGYVLGVRAVIHEQNVLPGRANRILSYFVSTIALSFEKTERYFRKRHKTGALPEFVWTGNPVRQQRQPLSREDARKSLGLAPDKWTLMIMGGSQGSQPLNRVFFDVLGRMSRRVWERLQVIHLTGQKDFELIKSDYALLPVRHYISPFLPQIERAYGAADLVICRAGAGCLTELSYYACPAILIPYPYADSHQVENARYFAEREAALFLEQAELSAGKLGAIILDLIDNPDKLQSLSASIKALSCPEAGYKLAHLLIK